jgi:hypothetical protein
MRILKTVLPQLWTGFGFRISHPRRRVRPADPPPTEEPDPGSVNPPWPVYVPPVDATGATDVGAALSAWIATVPAESIIRFAPQGVYRIDDASVLVKNRDQLRFEFNGAKFLRTRLIDQHLRYPDRNGHFRLLDSTRIEIWEPQMEGVVYDSWLDPVTGERHPSAIYDRRGTLRSLSKGTRTDGLYSVALEFEHGIDISGCSDVDVYGGSVSGVGGDGVFLRGDRCKLLPLPGTPLAHGCGLVVDRNGRQGIAHTRGNDCKIIGVDVVGSRRGSINMEPLSSSIVNNVEVAYCRTRGNGLGVTSSGGGQVNNAHIHHNHNVATGTPYLHNGSSNETVRRSNWIVEYNTGAVGGSSAPGMRFLRVDGVIVRYNNMTFPASRNMAAVACVDCTGIDVHSNTWPGAAVDLVIQ